MHFFLSQRRSLLRMCASSRPSFCPRGSQRAPLTLLQARSPSLGGQLSSLITPAHTRRRPQQGRWGVPMAIGPMGSADGGLRARACSLSSSDRRSSASASSTRRLSSTP
eukprot:1559183-Pleurochrysis_carterae.AAC.3